ncbi:rhodanese-like domain-containing protein [Pseudoruegeria sp. SK021]|uniref:rhodanese-like domain-containing protein n=1 Tax=Pseudoruegeria sp. SK021 TaxID=1933035 RepID=UPI00143DA25A|nr:rhodanese-like domain-containing protein [Pseudoruegeria sp. SK021]
MPTEPDLKIAQANTAIARIDPVRALQQILAGQELAFLDVREDGEIAAGHPFFTVACPYSRLETEVAALVPRTTVPVLLLDGGDGIADRAAAALIDMNYTQVSVVAGGFPGWCRAGLSWGGGAQLSAQARAEMPVAGAAVDSIDADTLVCWQASGQTVCLVDCSAEEDFSQATVPGARWLPTLELACRLPALTDAETCVVLSSVGNNDALTGASLLALSGFKGPVALLEDGSCGWALSGRDLARGNRSVALPELDRPAQVNVRAAATDVLSSHHVPLIGHRGIDALRCDPHRTTFLFDIRSPAEAKADPLRAFTCVPGSNLIAATAQWIGVRRAQVVLADDLGLRGALAAIWLRQLGHDVHVALVDDDLRSMRAVPGAAFRIEAPECSARDALHAVWSGKGRFLDLRPSTAFRAGHVPGSTWSVRPRLAALAADPRRPFYIIADGGPGAGLATLDLLNFGHGISHVIVGGFEELKAIGAPVESSPGVPSRRAAIDSAINDAPNYQSILKGGDDAMRQFLAWEKALLGQLDHPEQAEFGT